MRGFTPLGGFGTAAGVAGLAWLELGRGQVFRIRHVSLLSQESPRVWIQPRHAVQPLPFQHLPCCMTLLLPLLIRHLSLS